MSALAAVLALAAAPQEAGLRVSADFPGGSVRVESIDEETRTIRVLPAAHPDRGWACWWYFEVDGAGPGETWTVDVGGGVWATPSRAALSADGKTWTQTASGAREEKGRIRYRVEAPGRTFRLAWGPPFVLADARAAVEAAERACSDARAFELCRSREGRSVPAARFSPGAGARFGLWIQARQHAWEAGSSWVCRGFLEWLSSDDARAAALRRQAEIVVVPIMDVDNVERGAGGKEQKPQDHNRDWSADPHWNEVRAAQQGILEMARAGRFHLFVDLHNPGAGEPRPYYFVPPDELLDDAGRAALERFLAASREEIAGPLRLLEKGKPTGRNYDPRNWERISKNWVSMRVGAHVVSVTLETPWNTPHSTTEGYRRVGRELGLAIERFLRQSGE